MANTPDDVTDTYHWSNDCPLAPAIPGLGGIYDSPWGDPVPLGRTPISPLAITRTLAKIARAAEPETTPWYENDCIKDALKDAALHVAIDGVGLIPEAGGISRMVGHQFGYVGVVADHAGFKVVDAFGKSTAALYGVAGVTDTSAEGIAKTALTGAGFIPGVGQVAAGLLVGLDIFTAAKAIGECH